MAEVSQASSGPSDAWAGRSAGVAARGRHVHSGRVQDRGRDAAKGEPHDQDGRRQCANGLGQPWGKDRLVVEERAERNARAIDNSDHRQTDDRTGRGQGCRRQQPNENSPRLSARGMPPRPIRHQGRWPPWLRADRSAGSSQFLLITPWGRADHFDELSGRPVADASGVGLGHDNPCLGGQIDQRDTNRGPAGRQPPRRSLQGETGRGSRRARGHSLGGRVEASESNRTMPARIKAVLSSRQGRKPGGPRNTPSNAWGPMTD